MAQYQDGDRRFGMVRRNGVWVSDQQDSGAQQDESPSIRIGSPSPRLPYQIQQDQGQAAAAPYAAPKAAADLVRTQQQNQSQPLQNEATQQGIVSSQQQRMLAQQQAAQQFGQQFLGQPEVKTFGTIAPQYGSALRAAKRGNKAGDLDLVNAFAKILDPNSVVRESEVDSAANVGSVADKAKAYMSSIDGNGSLTEAQRAEIVGQIRNRASAAADEYRLSREHFTGLAQKFGYDPAVLGPNPQQPFQQIEADYFGHPIKNGNSLVQPHGQQPGKLGEPGSGPVQPLDPEGVGDIGFYNRDALSAPPKAQEAQKDIQAAILSGSLRTPEAISGYAKQKWGFDIPPAQAKAAADAVLKGGSISVATPQYAKPDISADRGGKPLQGLDAIIRGATDVATRGLSDEAAAGLDTLGGGNFSSNLARERAIDHYDMKNQPGLRLGGQVAGGFMMPFAGAPKTIAGLAKMGAIEGGLYGFGSGQGSLLDRGLNAAGGTVTGGAAGAALGAGGNAIARGVRGLFGRKGSVIPPLVDQATGRVNQPLESATPAQRMQAAQQFGIDLPAGAAGDRTAAIIEKGLDVMPASAGVMNDSRRAVQGQTESALSQLAQRYGTATTLDAAGRAAQQGAKNWIGRFEEVASKAYNAIPISDRAQASTSNTQALLGQLTSQFQSNPALAETLKNPRLNAYMDALSKGPLSWQDLKAFRTRIGSEIGDQRFSDSPSRDELRGLYGSLSEDMRATAAAQGPRALRSFDRANTLYAQGQQRIDGALVRILGDDSMKNPEAAAKAIQTIAQSGTGAANIRQLQQIRASMQKGNEWGDVASSLIHLLGQPADKEGRTFNPQTFIDSYANMTEPARNLLFGDGGRKELRQALDQFVAVNQRLAGTNALRNTSNTVPGYIGAGAVGAVSASIAKFATEPSQALMAAGGTAAVAGANYGIARMWTSPAFVRWATGYSRVAASGNQRAVQGQIGALRRVAATNPLIRDSVEELMRNLMGQGQQQ